MTFDQDQALRLLDPTPPPGFRSFVGDFMRHGTIPPEAADCSTLVEFLRRHRVLGLVENPPDSTVLCEAVRDTRRQIAVLHIQFASLLTDVVESFRSHSIDTRLLKGMATAHLDYAEPRLRHTGDIDLLVNPTDLDRAVSALVASGLRPYPTSSHVDPRLLKGSTLVSPNGIEVDLHTRLSRYANQPSAQLFDRPAVIDQLSVAALPVELRLVHAATHFVFTPIGQRRLSGLADVTRILDRHPGLDIRVVREWADSIGVAAATGAGLAVEAALTGRTMHPPVLWPPPSRVLRRAFLGPRRHFVAEHLLALQGFDRRRDKATYLQQSLLPNRDVVSSRGGLSGYWGKLFNR